MTRDREIVALDRLTVTYSTSYGELTALNEVSLGIEESETVAVVGESGSGKSTLALAVMGLLPDEAKLRAGAIRFSGQDLSGASAADWRRLRGQQIAMVFQDPFSSLNPSLPIGSQLAEPLIHHRGMTRDAASEKVVDLLREVGISRAEQVVRSYPHQLSGGMQQRALIAGALACEPRLLIMDEPTTALDVTIEAQILDILLELQRSRRLAILFITHNLGVVNQLADRLCVLYAGQVLEQGPTSEVLAQPLHPYTKGLLASLPQLGHGGGGRRLSAIAGGLPDLRNLRKGCVFHPRCPFAEESCLQPQELRTVGGDRRVRCHRFADLRGVIWPTVDQAERQRNRRREETTGGPVVSARNVRKVYSGSHGLWSWFRTHLSSKPSRSMTSYGIAAVNGITLSIAAGETVGLVGESGSGKSTFGRCLIRLTDVTDGQVFFSGSEITHLQERQLRRMRQHAQIIFQNPDSSLNPRKTIGKIVGRPLDLFFKMGDQEKGARVAELLVTVGLPKDYANRYPHQLSGGEKQRAGIARALASGPRFIVCDEPVSALDVSVQATVLNLLMDLRDRLGLAYLFISHDLHVVAHLADRIAVMYGGTICEEGPTTDVLALPYHPYTESLLSAVPNVDPRAKRQERIRLATMKPSGPSMSRGCPLHLSCPRKIGRICETTEPPVRETPRGHRIACHIPLEDLRRAQVNLIARRSA